MKQKRIFYTEAAYVVGILLLALGTAWMEKADFGMSMVVAPAYNLHLKISQYLPFFSFGMAEYCFQAFLLIFLSILLQKAKKMYLFSFVTAVIYGFTLDLMMKFAEVIPFSGYGGRIFFFITGMLLCSAGVSMLFHTYIAPEAYELFVKEFSTTYHKNINKVKTIYDCTSCLIAIVMSFLFWGWLHFEGVKLGTVICAMTNGWIIGKMSHYFEEKYQFEDGWKRK